MPTTKITVELDTDCLASYADRHLAMLWHVAQANSAPHGDRRAGELVERIGREIIRRWLRVTPPELWYHQGRDYYWGELRKLATFTPGSTDPTSADWYRGTWTPRERGAAQEAAGGC